MRLIFTTECNRFQHWQAQTLLSSALDAGQQGSFTHIVVGCERSVGGHARFSTRLAGSADGLVPREEWTRSIHPNVSVHFAPASPQADVFPWFNKPWGIRHWARTAPPSEQVVVLLDPDQFFLSPLTHGIRPASTLLGLERLPSTLPSSLRTDRPRPGLAVAQVYGLGGGWVRKFNGSRICGAEPQPCAAYPDVSSAGAYYSVGPPYLWHATDVRPLADAWWDAMGPAYEEEGTHDIQLDMYAYGLAAAASGVAHVQLAHYMVSSPDEVASEAWKFVDALPSMSCRAPTYPSGALLPTVVHACQHYKACSDGRPLAADGSCDGEGRLWNFHKGHVPGGIMSCDATGLMVPPDDLFDVQTTSHGRHAAFMICQLTSLINRAAHSYKRQNCPAGWQEPAGCTRLSLSGSTNLPPALCPAGFGGGRMVEAARLPGGQRKAAGTLMSLLTLSEGSGMGKDGGT